MRLLKLFVALCLLAAFSCKKDSDSVDLTPNFYFVNGGSGATAFGRNLILFPAADTVTVNIVASSTYLLPKPTMVTLAVADEYRVNYNTVNGTDYKAMPGGAYIFENSFTAGTSSVYDTIAVKIIKNSLLGDNYLLPIKIITAGDYKIDTGTSIIYLNTNDNMLSGIYTSALSKKLYNDTGVVAVDTSLGKRLIPSTSQSSLLDYADLGANGWKYILTYDGAGLIVVPNDVIKSSISTGTFKVLDAKYNPPSPNIYIKTSYKNLSGYERIVEETLTLQ